jgi:hypothetical protein
MQNNKGQFRFGYPKEFCVEHREVVPRHFDYVVDPLIRVFQAAIQTGNPVRWC